jgi:hypothetical protein
VIDSDEKSLHILVKFPVSHFVKILSAVLYLFLSDKSTDGHTDTMKQTGALLQILFANAIKESEEARVQVPHS